MPTLEGKRMIIFISPKKVTPKKEKEGNETENTEREVRVAPKQKARKEYTGPKVEGEDF